MDNINFKKVLDDGELFDQQANYEENFEKINQEVVPKITDLETNKVDKVEGKGLSTNDFDNTYKQKIDTDIPAQLADIENKWTPGKNKLSLENLTYGVYVNYTHGRFSDGADFVATDYIPLLPSTTYTLSGTTQQFAYYDVDKTFIIGEVSGSNPITFTTPANCSYGRFTISKSVLDSDIQLEEGGQVTGYEPYNVSLKVENLEKSKLTMEYLSSDVRNKIESKEEAKKTVIVKQDGTGDFTNLRQAVESITDASESNPYDVLIHEGIYDVMSNYASEEINSTSFFGLPINDYVSFKGIGQKNNIVIKGELADSFSNTTIQRVSTVCKYGTGDLINVTITAKNLRYVVHDDYNFPNLRRKVKGCDFIKYAGGGNVQAYGGGTRNGMLFEFEDCYFYTEGTGVPFSFHNNVNLTAKSDIKLLNCTFENIAGQYAMRFGSMGSGVDDTIDIVGCKMQGGIRLFEEQSNGVGIDYKLTGHSNDNVPIKVETNVANQSNYEIVGDTKKMLNGSEVTTIYKGEPVRLNSFGSALLRLTDSSTHLLYGIALETILPKEKGVVKVGGYLNVADTPLTGLAIGNKIGITSGQLAVVSSGEIGAVTMNEWIKLKF